VETWRTTAAGRRFRTLLEGVRRGRRQLVGESGRVEAALADAKEIGDLLGAAYCFRPKTAFGGHGAEIWLPEVGAHVVGATLHEARRELAAAMLDHDAAAAGTSTTFARPSPALDGTQPRRWMGPRDRLAQVNDARSNEHEPA